MPVRSTRCLGAFAVLALGCIGSLNPKEIVVSPRILDIVAEPPEIGPTGTTQLHAVVAGNHGPVTYQWVSCVAANPLSGFGGFGAGSSDTGCTGDAGPRIPLGSGETATLTIPPGAVDVDALVAQFGDRAPRALVEQYIRDVGVIVGVGLTIAADGKTVTAYKRVVISLNPHPNQNPPRPRLQVNGRWVSVPAAGGADCVPEEGDPIAVPRDREATLAPDPDESWQEHFTVLTALGTFEDRTEQAFYSWYADSGDLGRGLTRSPTRDNVWRPSNEAGARSLWFFVRDGHGGTSGCRLDVTVQ